jgi:2-keto-4-pentenoate hydratase
MLLEDNAELALDYAARPAVEADLLVRVRDPNINEAKTDLELLAGLGEVIPFIELADLLLLPGASNDLRTLTALNAGARTGVVGTPVALTADQATLDRLGSFTVRLEDEKGRLYGAGRGADLLGHPIHVVRWMRDALRARGDRLREGDVLSLGTLDAGAGPEETGPTHRPLPWSAGRSRGRSERHLHSATRQPCPIDRRSRSSTTARPPEPYRR